MPEKLTYYEFLRRANKIHGDRYNYACSVYINSQTSIAIQCMKHGYFNQRPNNHLSGKGCPSCGIESRSKKRQQSFTDFICKANTIHGDLYIYNRASFVKFTSNTTITCIIHGDFEQTPKNHCSGQHCPACSKNTYSQMGINWLATFNNPNIKHAENGGEHRIKIHGSKRGILVDGFDPESNTVYEFLGDRWHGNLNIYKPSECCHPFNKTKTAKALNDEWLDRRLALEDFGYNIIHIWEEDYKHGIR